MCDYFVLEEIGRGAEEANCDVLKGVDHVTRTAEKASVLHPMDTGFFRACKGQVRQKVM